MFPIEPVSLQDAEQREARISEWIGFLADSRLPTFVANRLGEAAAGRRPWIATTTPAELMLVRNHGIRPIATVSGTCCYRPGAQWTMAHNKGWRRAIDRLREEAEACSANAVIGTRLRHLRHFQDGSSDFTIFGTAVRVDALPPSSTPLIATVPALEFVQLLKIGIVPIGLAIGAHNERFADRSGRVSRSALQGNFPLKGMSNLWARSLHKTYDKLRKDAAAQGNGLLGSVHRGEIIKGEREAVQRYMARHIVIGTVIDTPIGTALPFDVEPVLDMKEERGHRSTDLRYSGIEIDIAL